MPLVTPEATAVLRFKMLSVILVGSTAGHGVRKYPKAMCAARQIHFRRAFHALASTCLAGACNWHTRFHAAGKTI